MGPTPVAVQVDLDRGEFSLHASGSPSNGFRLRFKDGVFRDLTGYEIAPGRWTHLIATYDGGQMHASRRSTFCGATQAGPSMARLATPLVSMRWTGRSSHST